MNKQTKIALTLSPIMLAMSGMAEAATCASPCDVTNASSFAEMHLNTSGQDWEVEVNASGTTNSEFVIGLEGGSAEPFRIDDDATSSTVFLSSAGRVGINTNAPAEELEINSTLPKILLDDTTTTTGLQAYLTVSEDKFYIEDANGTDQVIVELNGSTTNQLYLDSDGDVGIQVANPVADLHVGGFGDMMLENGTNDWGFNSGGTGLFFRVGNNTPYGTAVMQLYNTAPTNSIVATSTGVGIGTPSPTKALHVRRTDGQGTLIVEEAGAVTQKLFQVQLINNGGTGFKFKDTSVPNRQWQVATLSNGSFTNSFLNTGGAEMEITTLGRVKMGPGPTTNFDLRTGGNLLIPNGSVSATNFVTLSSHTAKKDFEKVEADSVMDKLKTLEVTKWRYKDPEVKGQHIGPMAEDFYKLFELGPDERHVSGTDMASIALIASKELINKSEAFSTVNADLKLKTDRLFAENESLKKRLATLEKLVTNLASGNGTLSSNGEKVALNK